MKIRSTPEVSTTVVIHLVGTRFENRHVNDYNEECFTWFFSVTWIICFTIDQYSRSVSQNQLGLHIMNKFPSFYGNRKFITVLKKFPSYSFKIHFNIILRPTLRSWKQPLSFLLSHQNPIWIPLLCSCHMPLLPDDDILQKLSTSVQVPEQSTGCSRELLT